MAGPPRCGHPAACLARANRIVPAAPAGGRNAARPCRPSGFLGPRRPACRPGAAPPGRDWTRAAGSSGRAAQRGPRGQNRRTGMRREPVAVMSEATQSRKANRQAYSACGGAAKGGMGASAAARRLARRIRQPWTGSWDGNRARAAAPAGMPKGARRAGSKAARRRGVTPNGPAGLRSGQRQRRAGNPIFGPIAFIALNACMRSTFALAFGKLGYF